MFRTEGARAGKGVGGALGRVLLPAGCRHAAEIAFGLRLKPAVGRKPPAVFRTEGARAGKSVGGGVGQGPFARRLLPCG